MYKEKMAQAIERFEELGSEIAWHENDALDEIRAKKGKGNLRAALVAPTGNEPYEMAKALEGNFYYKKAVSRQNHLLALAQMYGIAALVQEAYDA